METRKDYSMRSKFALLLFIGLLSACTPALAASSSNPESEAVSTPTAVQVTPQPAPTNSVNPYSLEALAGRSYGQGELRIEYAWQDKGEFTRYYITYDSDGLNIHGYVNVPTGKGPFPVVIALHGYIPADEYETLDYSTRYADSIARKGYIVLHPNLRNFPPSDSPGRLRDSLAGYTVDVLNLLAYVREMAGKDGIFENADLEDMGIWGHSLGGGVAMRVVSLVPEIKAAVLYGAVSQRYSNDAAGFAVFDLESSSAAFSIHHGEADEIVPPEWSRTLCSQLEEMGKAVECYFYEDQPHTFIRTGDADPLFIQRTVEFFDRYLKVE
jgi:dienelactone hydrolase